MVHNLEVNIIQYHEILSKMFCLFEYGLFWPQGSQLHQNNNELKKMKLDIFLHLLASLFQPHCVATTLLYMWPYLWL